MITSGSLIDNSGINEPADPGVDAGPKTETAFSWPRPPGRRPF